MLYRLPTKRVEALISRMFPDEDVGLLSMSDIPSSKLTRQYELNLTNSTRKLLNFPPPLSTHLLRHEQKIVLSAASLISFLASEATELGPAPDEASRPPDSDKAASESLPIRSLIPRILKYSSDDLDLSLPYTIFTQAQPGVTLSSVSAKLEPKQRQSVDHQIGRLVRVLSTVRSPSNRFGPALGVCPRITTTYRSRPDESLPHHHPPPSSSGRPSPSKRPRPSPPSDRDRDQGYDHDRDGDRDGEVAGAAAGWTGTGTGTARRGEQHAAWSGAFAGMLEAALRDAEDGFLLLPYDDVRTLLARFAPSLDAVATPRLLLLDAGEETNVLVEWEGGNCDEEDGGGGGDGGDGGNNDTGPPTAVIKLVGLAGWGHGVFGDPLMSTCLEDPSDALLAGWKGDSSSSSNIGGAAKKADAGGAEEVWGDAREMREAEADRERERKLLYKCYHAIVGIVREHYRPGLDSSRLELEARRKLTSAVGELKGLAR